MIKKSYMVHYFFLLITCLFQAKAIYKEGSRKSLLNLKALYLGTIQLETERLILRKITTRDIQDIFAFSSDPEVETWNPIHKTSEDTQRFISSLQEKYSLNEPTLWGIEHRQDKKIIGYCGITEFLAQHSVAELEYVLAKSYWSKGIMTEAVSAVVNYAFTQLKINKIVALTHLTNYGSMRVLEKIGMYYEGLRKETGYAKGAFWDLHAFAFLRKDFLSKEKL